MAHDKRTVWRPEPRIRPIAIGIIWRGDHLLVEQVCDDDGQVDGWRPIGGGIEFGERAGDALKREFAEELNETIGEPTLLTVMENHYEHYGLRGHEVAFVFEASFADPQVLQRDTFEVQEADMTLHAEWKLLDPFAAGHERLYPEGLAELLAQRKQLKEGQ